MKFYTSDSFHPAAKGVLSEFEVKNFDLDEKECSVDSPYGVFGAKGD